MNEELMKVVAVTGDRKSEIISIKKPEPKENEIQIRIHACALCTWEQRVFIREKNTPLPMIGGHEISGEISAIGSNVNKDLYPIGAKVTGRVQKSCGSCYYCRRGEPTQCVELNTFLLNGPDVWGMGGLAEYICLDRSAVWIYDNEKISYPEMALTEPVACVLNSIERAHPIMGDDAVIIGGGVMGQIHIMLLHKLGLRTILSEPDENRRKFALEHGCDIAFDPTKVDAVKKVKEITDGRGVENVFNTTAVAKVEADAIAMTGKLGTCVTYSSQHPDSPVPVSPGWLHSSESKLTGAVNPSIKSFDRSVNVLSKGIISVKDLISEVYDKEDSTKAFESALSPSTYRVVIKF